MTMLMCGKGHILSTSTLTNQQAIKKARISRLFLFKVLLFSDNLLFLEYDCRPIGGVAERFKALVLKTSEGLSPP